MDARVAKTVALLMAVSYPIVASDETDHGTELKRQVTQDRGPHWLFVPHGHVDLGAEEVRFIGQWVISHDTGWKPASVLDFSPSKRQFLTANCVIEIDGDRIVVTYMRKTWILPFTFSVPFRPMNSRFGTGLLQRPKALIDRSSEARLAAGMSGFYLAAGGLTNR